MFNYGNVLRNIDNGALFGDNTAAQFRINQWAEQIVSPLNSLSMATEGSTYSSNTPTPGTGIPVTTATATTFVATAPAFLIRNTDQVGAKDVIIRRLRLIAASAGVGLTSLEGLVVIDTEDRYVSGGALNGPTVSGNSLVTGNLRADLQSAGIAQIRNASTAIVASAAGSGTRTHSRVKLRTGIPVLGDVYTLAFGAEPAAELGPLSGTAAQGITHSMPALVIPPQTSALIYLWGPAMTTAPTFEVIVEHVER